jgi:RNA polymerase sigma-70 factor, ECF subfamily
MRSSGSRPSIAANQLGLVRQCEHERERERQRERDDTRAAPDLAELYDRYADRVLRWALRFGAGDVAWAEDVTQDVFMSLVRHAPELEDAHDLGGWFYRVTANRCLNELRRQRVLRALSAALSAVRADPEPTRTPEAVVIARGELDDALQAIRCLPSAQRVAFCMRHLDGLAQQEIGRILGYSKGHVSRLLKRAGSRLRAAGWRLDDD